MRTTLPRGYLFDGTLNDSVDLHANRAVSCLGEGLGSQGTHPGPSGAQHGEASEHPGLVSVHMREESYPGMVVSFQAHRATDPSEPCGAGAGLGPEVFRWASCFCTDCPSHYAYLHKQNQAEVQKSNVQNKIQT